MKVRDLNLVEIFSPPTSNNLDPTQPYNFSVRGIQFQARFAPIGAGRTKYQIMSYFAPDTPRALNFEFDNLSSQQSPQDTTGDFTSDPKSTIQLFQHLLNYAQAGLAQQHLDVLVIMTKSSQSPTNFKGRVRMFNALVTRMKNSHNLLVARIDISPNDVCWMVASNQKWEPAFRKLNGR